MGTRSRIGVMHGDVCKSVYCHWDGYLEHNGAILLEHYDSSKANHLVALGDLSSLRAELGEKHAFSQFDLPADQVESYKTLTENWCTFYGRDRGESGTEWKVAHTFEEFFDQCEECGAEYYYIMENGQWYCGSTNERDPFYQRLVLLSDALESQTVDQ
jgi:hypothetical protein